jgi:hypothetical protein
MALQCIQKAVELNPGHFLLWLEQGRCQEALGLISIAEHSFTQARQLNRNCPEADHALMHISQTGWFARGCGKLRELFRK